MATEFIPASYCVWSKFGIWSWNWCKRNIMFDIRLLQELIQVDYCVYQYLAHTREVKLTSTGQWLDCELTKDTPYGVRAKHRVAFVRILDKNNQLVNRLICTIKRGRDLVPFLHYRPIHVTSPVTRHPCSFQQADTQSILISGAHCWCLAQTAAEKTAAAITHRATSCILGHFNKKIDMKLGHG